MQLVTDKKTIDAGDMSANITGTTIDISMIEHVAHQIIWSGTSPVGTITIQGSLDSSNFSTISTTAVAANTGSVLTNIPSVGYPYIRATYTATSGVGTLNITVSGKC